jgi:hypothetical protein
MFLTTLMEIRAMIPLVTLPRFALSATPTSSLGAELPDTSERMN